MKTYKQIRRRYVKALAYYMKNVNELHFETADFWYSVVYEMAWVLNRDCTKDIQRLINARFYIK